MTPVTKELSPEFLRKLGGRQRGNRELLGWVDTFRERVEAHAVHGEWTAITNLLVQMGLEPIDQMVKEMAEIAMPVWSSDCEYYTGKVLEIVAPYKAQIRRVIKKDLKVTTDMEGYGKLVQHEYSQWLLELLT